MNAYIINLDRAKDRWASVEQSFAGTKFDVCRVAAVKWPGFAGTTVFMWVLVG